MTKSDVWIYTKVVVIGAIVIFVFGAALYGCYGLFLEVVGDGAGAVRGG